jgi:precorrin-3B synthase
MCTFPGNTATKSAALARPPTRRVGADQLGHAGADGPGVLRPGQPARQRRVEDARPHEVQRPRDEQQTGQGTGGAGAAYGSHPPILGDGRVPAGSYDDQMPPEPRRADRCPGVLRPHLAADGAMVRVRVPGGQTTGAALRDLSRLAEVYGSGLLQLTSRASVQVRGLPEAVPEPFEDAVGRAGFLPSAGHERVRNIVASPLTGLAGGQADLRPLVARLDRALLAEPRLAELPGRFLFVLDDGRGDVAPLGGDLGYRALDAGRGELLVGDRRRTRPLRLVEVADTLAGLALRFLERRTEEWHVRQLPGPLLGGTEPQPADPSDRAAGTRHLAPGVVGDHLVVDVPLGLLSPVQVDAVHAAVGGGPVVVTPWRSLVLPDAAPARSALESVGLVTQPDQAWSLVSACVGAPWCSNGRSDTQTLAAQLVAAGGPGGRTHLSGCERRCGAPAEPHADLVAPTRVDLAELLLARA